MLLAFLQTPVYEPVARLEIDSAPADPLSREHEAFSPTDAEYLETQAKILESDHLAIAVIRNLHLDQNVNFLQPNKVPFVWRTLAQLFHRRSLDPPAVQPGRRGMPELSPRENAALRVLRSHLEVKRDTASRLVMVSYSSPDPRLAALITNTLVETFIEYGYRARHDSIMQSSQWLSKQLDDVREAMQRSDRALADYERSSGIVGLGGDEQQSTLTQELSGLNQQLTSATTERIGLQALLNNSHEGAGTSLPQVRADPVIEELTRKLASIRIELSQAAVLYGPNHPTVRKLNNQVDELDRQLDAQRRLVLGGIVTNYAAANAREKLLSRAMARAVDQMNHLEQYSTLRKEAQTNRDLYNTLYTRIKEAGIAAESRSSNIRVIDEARVLDTPTKPNRVKLMLLAIVFGLVGGVLIAFFTDTVDRRIRDIADLRQITGIGATSIIPKIEGISSSRRLDARSWRKKDRIEDSQLRFNVESDGSPVSEALRGLETSLALSHHGISPTVIQVVSALSHEGKTLVAVNLALILAQHRNVCIVDADLRSPRIAKAFDFQTKCGLADVLEDATTLENACVQPCDAGRLTVLPAHVSRHDPAHLFISQSMHNTLELLRQKFEYVLIDSPPIIPFPDGRAIAHLADALILVTRYGFTPREDVGRAMELLTQVHAAPIIQVVLTDVQSGDFESYYGYPNT